MCPKVHCECSSTASRLASDASEGVCNWTWAITCRVGITAVRVGEDTRGVRISSRWICCFTSGRRASQREVAVQAKRKLDNTQIRAICADVTAFDTSMGRIPLSRLFVIKKLHQLL